MLSLFYLRKNEISYFLLELYTEKCRLAIVLLLPVMFSSYSQWNIGYINLNISHPVLRFLIFFDTIAHKFCILAGSDHNPSGSRKGTLRTSPAHTQFSTPPTMSIPAAVSSFTASYTASTVAMSSRTTSSTPSASFPICSISG